MNTEEMVDKLINHLDCDDEIKNIHTFEDAMILTTNYGIVVRMEDGSEFQITIVQSK